LSVSIVAHTKLILFLVILLSGIYFHSSFKKLIVSSISVLDFSSSFTFKIILVASKELSSVESVMFFPDKIVERVDVILAVFNQALFKAS